MNEFLIVLSAVLPVFGVVLIGLLIRKLHWLSAEADQSLLRVNINLLYPCLILDTALGNPALGQWKNLLLAPVVGFSTVAVGFLLALGFRKLAGLASPQEKGTFVLTVGLYNYGYIPLPLALLLFSGPGTVGVLFVHNVGVEIALWTLGVLLLTGGNLGRDWRKILNAPLLAILFALLLNSVGAHDRLPQVVLTILHLLGQCAIPMALILIGAVVADHLEEFHSDWGWKVIANAVLLRMLILPAGFLILAKLLPASIELKRVMILEAAMPAAVFPIVMTRHYGGDPATALRVVIGTSLVGLITIPLWIRFGLSFVLGS